MDLFLLLINSLLYLFILYQMKRRYGLFNIGTLYMVFYTMSAILAIHLYGYYYHRLYSWDGQNLFCLIYLLFFIVLFINLLNKYKFSNKQIAHPPGQFINPLCVSIILVSLIDIIDIWENFSTGIILLLTDEEYGNELYLMLNDSVHSVGSREGNVLNVLSTIGKSIAPLLLVYYLTRPGKNLFITIGLIAATLMSFMHGISVGSRHALVSGLMNLIAGFYLLRHFYSNKTMTWLRPIAIGAVSVIVLSFGILTISRSNATHEGKTFAFVESYVSQSFLYFGKYGFDNGERRDGDRIVPLIKSIFVKDVARSYVDREQKFKHMKIRENVFVTFVGDCVFDFGVIGGALFLFLLYYTFKAFLNKKGKILYFDQIIILYLICNLLNGFYLWPFSDFGGNLKLFTLLLLVFFFNLTRKQTHVYKPA